jgi:phage terminase large subunit-like protein
VESPCYQLRKSLIDILAGRKQDETFFGVIYTLDPGDDWNDKATWVKANPNIGVTPKWDFMESEYTKAVNEGGTSEVEFKTKNLNVWTSSAETWIADELWQGCHGAYDEKQIEGADCVGGLDLASVSDFCALCLRFHGNNTTDAPIFKWWFWLPEDKISERSRDLPDLLRWVNEGWIKATPGNVTDYDYIRAELNEIRGKYNVLMLGYDPHNALQIVAKLQQEDGLPMQEFSQSILHMSPPTKEFERRVRQKGINHGSNPVARWMLSNVEPWRDANGNIKLYKAKGKRELKIDGIVAAIMAEGEYMSADLTVYSSDILII